MEERFEKQLINTNSNLLDKLAMACKAYRAYTLCEQSETTKLDGVAKLEDLLRGGSIKIGQEAAKILYAGVSNTNSPEDNAKRIQTNLGALLGNSTSFSSLMMKLGVPKLTLDSVGDLLGKNWLKTCFDPEILVPLGGFALTTLTLGCDFGLGATLATGSLAKKGYDTLRSSYEFGSVIYQREQIMQLLLSKIVYGAIKHKPPELSADVAMQVVVPLVNSVVDQRGSECPASYSLAETFLYTYAMTLDKHFKPDTPYNYEDRYLLNRADDEGYHRHFKSIKAIHEPGGVLPDEKIAKKAEEALKKDKFKPPHDVMFAPDELTHSLHSNKAKLQSGIRDALLQNIGSQQMNHQCPLHGGKTERHVHGQLRAGAKDARDAFMTSEKEHGIRFAAQIFTVGLNPDKATGWQQDIRKDYMRHMEDNDFLKNAPDFKPKQ
jgi:hypothetical protein